jgi:hypothetical protein
MSVQLILYPQGLIPDNPNEFVVNGINFTNLSSAITYSSSVATAGTPAALIQNVLTNAPPTIPNLWYRFISTASATPLPPTNVSNNAVFNSVGATSGSGIYQKMTNLIPGESYNFNVDFSNTAFAGVISCAVYDGTTFLTQNVLGTNVGLAGIGNFWTQPANSTTATIVLTYSSAFSQNFTIQSVSVQSQQLVSNITTPIEDGQVILDLYEDENIPLTLSVDEFKNVAEQVQSYSKAFNLPATKRNNQIFENLFEVTRSAQNSITFNPYVRSRSILKQDGFILFEGYLRVLDIQDKEGEISYNVNLYSEIISFADALKDKTFSQLDFTELEHDYNRIQIKNSWNDSPDPPIAYTNSSTSGYRDGNTTVKYPFVDWTHQILISDGLGNNSTAGFPELTALEQAFRPFINIKYLIDRIFQDTEFTYESAFFNEVDFNRLYMDFNWGGNEAPNPGNEYAATWKFGTGATSNIGTGAFKEIRLIPEGITGGVVGSSVPPNYDTTTYIITATTDGEKYNVSYNFKFRHPTAGVSAINYKWVHTPFGGSAVIINALYNQGIVTTSEYVGNFEITLNTGDTLKAQFSAPSSVEQDEIFPSSAVFIVSSAIISSATLNTLRGELGQWEFLKGIMTMFNLVASPDKSNPKNIIIEPYKDMFLPSITGTPNFFDNNSTQLDWTDKIDTTEIKLEVLADLNKTTIFKFVEDDDDYAFNLYKTAVQGHLYGSLEFDASYFSGLPSVLEGEEEIIAEPFAATVPKPLMSQFSDFITPSIYSYNADDGTSEGFENSPRIMYNNGVKILTSCTYYIPAQNGVSESNYEDGFLQFSHLTDIPTVATNPPDPDDTVDFHFGECQLIQPIGNATPDNLFSIYWLPYFNELYNPDTRTMTLKVNLTPGDINTFNFYDTVFIKNRLFRVNKIDYKPNELATVEFILIP